MHTKRTRRLRPQHHNAHPLPSPSGILELATSRENMAAPGKRGSPSGLFGSERMAQWRRQSSKSALRRKQQEIKVRHVRTLHAGSVSLGWRLQQTSDFFRLLLHNSCLRDFHRPRLDKALAPFFLITHRCLPVRSYICIH